MKVLLLDIETAPHLVMAWGLWDQNIALDQIKQPGYTLCWSAKWLGSKEVMFSSVRTGKKLMLKRIHKLLDEADAVVHYNGTRFDIPTLNGEFVIENMKPPSPVKQIDLLQTARKQFRLPSNKLDYVAGALGLGQKVRHRGMALWIGCMAGNADDWAAMEEYNKGDVALLEKVYYRLLPWVKGHPNHGQFNTDGLPVCTNCGSTDMQRRGYARTAVNVYARFQCKNCGTWSRAGFTESTKEERRLILRPAS